MKDLKKGDKWKYQIRKGTKVLNKQIKKHPDPLFMEEDDSLEGGKDLSSFIFISSLKKPSHQKALACTSQA